LLECRYTALICRNDDVETAAPAWMRASFLQPNYTFGRDAAVNTTLGVLTYSPTEKALPSTVDDSDAYPALDRFGPWDIDPYKLQSYPPVTLPQPDVVLYITINFSSNAEGVLVAYFNETTLHLPGAYGASEPTNPTLREVALAGGPWPPEDTTFFSVTIEEGLDYQARSHAPCFALFDRATRDLSHSACCKSSSVLMPDVDACNCFNFPGVVSLL
jgi:hypothetical protein